MCCPIDILEHKKMQSTKGRFSFVENQTRVFAFVAVAIIATSTGKDVRLVQHRMRKPLFRGDRVKNSRPVEALLDRNLQKAICTATSLKIYCT